MRVSLLYPSESPVPQQHRHVPSEVDLGLTSIVRALDITGQHGRVIAGLLAELNTDPSIIIYRQDVLDELLNQPALIEQLTTLLPALRSLAESGPAHRWSDTLPLVQVATRLAELECYAECVEGLATALHGASPFRATGLRALYELLESIRNEPDYRRLRLELPQMRAQIEQAGSVTIGINLDPQLRPESATIVSINQGRFAGKGTLLERLIGARGAGDAVRGITGIYKADDGQPQTPAHELFRDLTRLIERVAAPVADALERYTRIHGGRLSAVVPELVFYLGAVRLTSTLRAHNLALCRPVIAAVGERRCAIEQNYNLDLAIRLLAERPSGTAIVPNDVSLGPGEEIAILTGPNSGGKTTYARAIGQAQVLFQAGLLVPGRCATISPVDAIFTHFPAEERLNLGGGRLAQELEQVERIFAAASAESLILLNEPFTSTDYTSARTLASDILAGLRLLGARAVIVTHLRELPAMAAADGTPGAGVISLVALTAPTASSEADPAPSYQIERGSPQAHSYALALAARYGLSRAQLTARLRPRAGVPEA